jgi:carbon monoxide dehydrogenase subunit G
MSEYAEGSTEVRASAAEVMEVITDFEAYPQWAEVEDVEVLERGDAGRGTEVAFRVNVPVLGRAQYTLSYVYAPGDAGVSWTTKEARGAVRDIRGEYLLDELDDEITRVTYRLAVDLGVLVPGFIRTQGSERIIDNALERLRRRVEAAA